MDSDGFLAARQFDADSFKLVLSDGTIDFLYDATVNLHGVLFVSGHLVLEDRLVGHSLIIAGNVETDLK